MLRIVALLVAMAPWWMLVDDVERQRVIIDAPEHCSRAKIRSPERMAAAKELQQKSADDPLALQTDVQGNLLKLEVDPTARYIEGSNTMTVRCVEDGVTAFRFWLHSVLTINDVEIDGSDATWNRLDSATVEVDLSTTCDVGDEFVLMVDYEGSPVTTGLSSIVFEEQGGWPVVSTLSEPWFSYTWWPVKEDNRDKATFDLRLTVPSDLTVASNGVYLGATNLSGDRRRFRWATDYPMSPYLFAFSATRYNTFDEVFNYSGGSMPVEFFIYPDRDTEENRNGWRLSADMLNTFSGLYGLYPFVGEKYAIYQFPWGGGMEHQTATGQGGNNAFGESLTAHELAHQWWGDLVTCETWSDIWLNEGFATYSSGLWFEYRTGESDPASLRAYLAQARPTEYDEAIYIENPTDVGRIFSGNYSYRKGAWVVHMLRGVVGTETFFDILAAYRARFAFDTATSEDLREVAKEVWGADLEWFFDEWVYEGGAPAYRYGWQEHEIDGQRYLELALEQTQDEAAFTMPVDVEIAVASGPQRVKLWNTGSPQHFLVPVSSSVSSVGVDPDQWILTRSISAAAFVDGPPKLVSVDPAPGALLPVGEVLEMTLAFHEDVIIDEARFSLRRVGGEELTIAVAYDSDTHSARVVSQQPLAGGHYELTVGDGVVDSESGLALDGEMSGLFKIEPLPSGDGLPGGDAVITFHVSGARRPSSRVSPSG